MKPTGQEGRRIYKGIRQPSGWPWTSSTEEGSGTLPPEQTSPNLRHLASPRLPKLAAAWALLRDWCGSSSAPALCRAQLQRHVQLLPDSPGFPIIYIPAFSISMPQDCKSLGVGKEESSPSASKYNVLCWIKNSVSWKEGAFLSNAIYKAITLALGERGNFPESTSGELVYLFLGNSVRVAKVLIIFGYCCLLLVKRRHLPLSRKNSQYSAQTWNCVLSLSRCLEFLRLLALKSLLLWKFKAVLAVGYNKSLSQRASLSLSLSLSTWSLKIRRN